jgi:hypothetical protein
MDLIHEEYAVTDFVKDVEVVVFGVEKSRGWMLVMRGHILIGASQTKFIKFCISITVLT